MNYVALRMLFGDRAKYLMLLCGLTFSVMLIVQQGSIFWGLMLWSQSSITNVHVPIWVTDPGIAQVDEVKPIATRRSTGSVAYRASSGRSHSTRGSCGPGWRAENTIRSP